MRRISSRIKRKIRGLAKYNSPRDTKRIVDTRIAKSIGQQRAARYATIRKSARIDEKAILYESYWGRGIIDNPYAIFRRLLEDPAYSDYTHYWCIDDFEDCAASMAWFASYDNVVFVEVHSDEYMKALSSAKYLVNNVTFPTYFVKNEGQVYINTWHGTPLKSMGYEQAGGNFESANTVRNFLQADYLIAANSIMTSMYLESYKLRGILPGTVVEAGYPRNDLLLRSERDEILQKLHVYGIDVDPEKQVILYAPTWRQGTQTKAIVNGEELLDFKKTLEEHIDTSRYQVLIKPHQFVYNALKDDETYRGLLVPSTIDSNEILSICDLLISDYSSIFLDYMAVRRPILFFIQDADRYAAGRGLKYDLDELPGPYTNSITELARYIEDLDALQSEYAERYEAIRSVVCEHDDGKVTERLIPLLIEGQSEGLRVFGGEHTKKRLLLSVGTMLENGIVHSFLSLLNAFDYDEWDVTAYVSSYANDNEMTRKINEDINPNVRVLRRVGPIVGSPTAQVRREFLEQFGLENKLVDALYPDDILELEFKRAFGDASFDYIVDFCGYSRFFSPMLLKGTAKKKSVWLHNDIDADMHRVVLGKMPNLISLRLVKSLYPRYDHLVSCGKSVMEVNREKLSTPKTYDKFTFAKNTLDALRLKNSEEESDVFEIAGREYLLIGNLTGEYPCSTITYLPLPEQDTMSFVTMGRFSTEKNHAALITAFARFAESRPYARLYIIGGGPLEDKTRKLIAELNVRDSVILTGRLRNPYAVMRRSSCFILPSLHEGQPLVLLEARACGLPIIVSNFSSVKDSLVPNGQLVIEPTVEDIYEGMLSFERGEVPVAPFDIDEYNHEAYQEFVNAIV